MTLSLGLQLYKNVCFCFYRAIRVGARPSVWLSIARCSNERSYDGSVTLCACQTVGFQSKYFFDNWQRENVYNVGQSCGTKTLWRLIWSSVASTSRPWVTTLGIAQPGELCAMKQSSSSKIRESKLWNTKEQFGRGFNLAATSALGRVTVAVASAAPELYSTLINKLTDDKRSVVFGGAVRLFIVRCSIVMKNCQADEVHQSAIFQIRWHI